MERSLHNWLRLDAAFAGRKEKEERVHGYRPLDMTVIGKPSPLSESLLLELASFPETEEQEAELCPFPHRLRQVTHTHCVAAVPAAGGL